MTTASSTTAMFSDVALPRITIRYCTRCKWMLRAAYYAQELLSTFGPPAPPPQLAEVALQPGGSGEFAVHMTLSPTAAGGSAGETATDVAAEAGSRVVRLWDRAADGGFPETKELKRRVRDLLDPQRDLGHVDRRKEKGGGEGKGGEAEKDGGKQRGHGAAEQRSGEGGSGSGEAQGERVGGEVLDGDRYYESGQPRDKLDASGEPEDEAEGKLHAGAVGEAEKSTRPREAEQIRPTASAPACEDCG